MDSETRFFTVPRLAQRIGVTPAAVRNWIKRGYVEPPEELPATGESVYRAQAADRIERWYMTRVAHGGSRGPGAAQRRQRALVWLLAHQPKSANGNPQAER